MELAKSGDTTALRLCLERIMALIRVKDEAVSIRQLGTTLTDRGRAIMNASLTGQITPSEAATLLQALATQARVIEAEELAARLEALEEKLGDFCKDIDYQNYSRKEDLIGYFDAMKELREWLESINGKSLDPPSERPGFLDEIRRYETIERRCVNGEDLGC